VLDFAVALGQDRFRTSRMGPRHSAMMIEAFARALGVTMPGSDTQESLQGR
jgi:hypothetical protein